MNHPANSSRQSKSGYLRKQGGMVKTWHRRWFVLYGDCLFYYSKEDDLHSLGTIYLPGNKIISHTVNPDEPNKFLLEVIPGKLQPKLAANHETFLLWAQSDEERQDWIKAIRKVMFANIGGAIFGQQLEETMDFERSRSNRKVPYVVEACVEFLYKFATEVEGIFRLPGRTLLVRDLKNRFDEGEQIDLEGEDIDIHSVASLLKLFLRELPECLIPYRLYQQFMNFAMKFQASKGADSKQEVVNSLRVAMADLPIDSYNTLKYLCQFLHDISAKTHINKMTALNLATVFGPNIIRHPNMEDNPEIFMLTTADISQQLAFMFINHNDQVFTLEFETDGKSAPVAVDDLLNLGDDTFDSSSGDILQPSAPIAPQPVPRKSKGVSELSDIRFDQIRDRRAISIPNEVVMVDSDSEPSTPVTPDDSFRPFPVPRSGPVLPADVKPTFTDDGKPVPPLRRRYTRQAPSVPDARNGRMSSEHGNSDSDIISSSEIVGSEAPTDTNAVNVVNHIPQDRVSLNNESTEVIRVKHELESTQSELEALKIKYDNQSVSRSRSDERVRNLSAEISKIQTRYEDHIRVLGERHKQQIQEMCAKLEVEKSSRAEAVEKIVQLQSELHNYKMHYGELGMKELPPLYPS